MKHLKPIDKVAIWLAIGYHILDYKGPIWRAPCGGGCVTR